MIQSAAPQAPGTGGRRCAPAPPLKRTSSSGAATATASLDVAARGRTVGRGAQVFAIEEDSEGGMYVVMELLPGHDLQNFLKRSG